MVLGDMASGGLGSAGLEAGLGNRRLKGLFVLKPFQVYESVSSIETAWKYIHLRAQLC